MRRRSSSGSGSASRVRMVLLLCFLCGVTYVNYRYALGPDPSRSHKTNSKPSGEPKSGGLAVESSGGGATAAPTVADGNDKEPLDGSNVVTLDNFTSPPDTELHNISFQDALQLFADNQKVEVKEDIKQPTKEFFDVMELPDHGVLLPHDPTQVVPPEQWQACDPRDAEFLPERDRLCQAYLSNVNNMRSIKTLSAILKKGRTIKYKIYYHHNNIEAIVKVSQMKFVFEPVSEYLAFALDRELNLTRTPISAYVPLPLDFMKAAAAIVSPFYSQWFKFFVVDYEFTSHYFVPCDPAHKDLKNCALVTIQLWMKDVHSALMSNLAVPYEYDEHFAEKFYTPGYKKWPPKPLRLRAIGDILDRFIFDFMMGNTDRGLNDHNNFVYGGCDETTRCSPRPAEERTKGITKYAFIDHGSSFYSRKEPEDNPFTGNMTDIWICRFRRSTYNTFKKFQVKEGDDEKYPLPMTIKAKLPKNLFRVVSFTVFQHVQTRMEKVIRVVESCIEKHGDKEVFSLPEYWE